MKVKNIPIEQVKPYEKNPRKNDASVHSVAQSIEAYGWQQPIVVDKNNVIIAGHTRYKAALELGLKQIPAVVADKLTDRQVKAYRLTDNKTGELASWDWDMLGDELLDLLEDDLFTGFTDVEIADILGDIDVDAVFETAENVQREGKKRTTVVCPNCGEEIEV